MTSRTDDFGNEVDAIGEVAAGNSDLEAGTLLGGEQREDGQL